MFRHRLTPYLSLLVCLLIAIGSAGNARAQDPPADPQKAGAPKGEAEKQDPPGAAGGQKEAAEGQGGQKPDGGEAASGGTEEKTEDASSASEGKLTLEQIATRREAVSADPAVKDPASKEAHLAELNRAENSLRTAASKEADEARFKALLEGAEQRAGEIRAELDRLQQEPSVEPDIPADMPLDALEKQASDANDRLEAATEALDEAEDFERRQAKRPGELPALIAEGKRKVEQAEAELEAIDESVGSEAGRLARRTRLEATIVAEEAAIAAGEAELAFWKGLSYVESSVKLARLEKERTEKEARAWASVLAARRKEEAERDVGRAGILVRGVNREIAVVDRLAEETLLYATRSTEVATKTALIEEETRSLRARSAEHDKGFKVLRSRLERIGLVGQMGRLLRQTKRSLMTSPSTVTTVERAQAGQIEIERITITDRLRELERFEDLVEQYALEVSEEKRAEARPQIRRLLDSWRGREGFLPKLSGGFEDLVPALMDHAVARQELAIVEKNFRKYIDERILWVRSGNPADLVNTDNLRKELAWLFSPENWKGAVDTLVADVRDHPLINILAFVVIAALFILHHAFRRQLLRISESADMKWSFRPTVAVLILTMLLSLAGPLAIFIVAWRIRDVTDATSFTLAIAEGLRNSAFLLLLFSFFGRVCRPKGLADSHFRWSSRSLAYLRKQLRWFVVLILPVVFIVTTTDVADEALEWDDTLGPLTFCLGMVAYTIFVSRVLRPEGDVLKDHLLRNRSGWTYKLRHFWYPLALLTPVALGVAAGLGYFYTARQLNARVEMTIWWLVGLLVVEAMIHRWMLLAKRRLAVERARRVRAEAEASEAARSDESREALIEVKDVPAIDFSTINEQTRRLVRMIGFGAMILGGWLIWADGLPALSALDMIVLWGEGTDNPMHLADLLLAGLLFGLTIAATRNIPGLLEITLLQRMKLQAGELYAVTSIARYIIMIVGLVLSFGNLGIGWSKLQWLAAALSVGLGFGLQEIVANFISGLILLVERPIRVGDMVTVGTTTGMVTRIRMRATTIIDWDRRELIVPNKSFITSELINWTLSDTVSRIVFPVGVE